MKKTEMCLGEQLCQDGSDVEYCNIHNNDVCPTDFYYEKCPGILPMSPEHKECYKPNREINNSEYDCLRRSDETTITEEKENIDYESIKPCVPSFNLGSVALTCGDKCKRITDWCRGDHTSS